MKTIMWFVFVLGALSAAGKVVVRKPGQNAILECGVNTYNDLLVWKHGNKLLSSTPKSFKKYGYPRKGTSDIAVRSKERQETRLEISRVKIEDAGKFTCVADGKNHEHTLLVVSVSASPSVEPQLGSKVMLQCQVKGLISSDSPVQWKRPDGSPHAGSQTVELKSVALSDAGTWNCMFSYDGKTYNESLEIKVQEPETTALPPSQSTKDDRKIICHGVTHLPPSAALLLGLSWWVWVAVGVGCPVVVLLIIFVIVLCKRIKRRKRKFQAMKNGRQPLKPKKYCQCDCPAAAAKPQQGRRREKPSAPPLQPLLME